VCGAVRAGIIVRMAAQDETNELLREIRDLLGAQEGRYDKTIAANKALYEEAYRRMARRQIIAAIVIGVGVALIIYGSR
jgi:hypothetical protein